MTTTLSLSVPRLASVAPWLGVLLLLLMALNTMGGWVRLSGSGVAIPHWPLINGSLLPPLTAEGWATVQADWQADQARLESRVANGELVEANRGRQPADAAEFKRMFLTEWLHRLLAAVVGVVAAGCLTVVLRERMLRQQIGVPMVIAGGLILAQAVLGGALVREGTNTRWLFLHQGNAGAILACVLWSLMRLLDHRETRAPRRNVSVLLVGAAAIATWLQLLFGALLASSRHADGFRSEWPELFSVTQLWSQPRDVAWNLLNNAALHQWLHRYWAWALALMVVVAFVAALRSNAGVRQRLALQIAGTFLGVQMLLGVGNALVGMTPALSLAHQLIGMCLFLSLVLAWYDARHESPTSATAESEALRSGREGMA